MTLAWYRVASMGFGYLSAALIAGIVLFSLSKFLDDRALLHRVRRGLPQAGAAGKLLVLSGGNRRLAPGQVIRVPFEGTMGSSSSCDLYLPCRRVHMRSAFFWVEGSALHIAPLHKDGFLADDVPIEPGDEAVLEDGAVLCVGETKLVFRFYDRESAMLREIVQEPYVTTARRSKAQQGHGDGIGAPGRGEIRRERRKRQSEKKQSEDKKTRR